MDDVEAAAQRLGVTELEAHQPPPADLVHHRQVRQKREPHSPLHHALGRLDRLDFQHHVGHQAGSSEQAVGQRPVARAAVEEDQRLAGHVLQPHAPGAGDLRVRAGHEHQRVVPQAERLDLGMLQRAGEADLGLAAQDHLEHLLGVARPHRDHDLGMGRLEALEHVGQDVGADGERGGDLQRAAAGRAQVVHGLARQGHRVQQLLGVGTEGAAGRRQAQARLAADEEGDPEGLLQRPDAGADGRLGHPQGVRGPPEAAEGADGEEGLYLADLHPFTSLMASPYLIRFDYTHL